MARFKLIAAPGFTRQLRKGIWSEIVPKIRDRLAVHSANLIGEIGQYLVSIFDETEVAKSLRGGGSEDLPAHFGLTDTQATSLADAMGETIRESVSLDFKGFVKTVQIRATAVNKNYAEFMDLPGASYVSHPSEITIPVMHWLLINPDKDIGQAEYDIVFKGQGFDAQIQKVSRSRRAIMKKLKSLGGSGGYVLPEIVRGSLGQNFIEHVITRPGVTNTIALMILTRLK